MLSRIASRLQDLFTFGSEYRRQKRPLDISDSASPILKRPRLEEISKDNTDFESNVNLSRPGLNRGSQGFHSNECTPALPCDLKSAEEKRGAKLNGHEYSNSIEITEGAPGHTKHSFSKEEQSIHSLTRPSLNHSHLHSSSTNGDVSTAEESSSVFQKWLGFSRMIPEETNIRSKENSKNPSSTDHYLHKRVKTRESAVRQCVRMEEKKRYKAMLARYVSPGLLENVDLDGRPNLSPRSEVVAVVDSDSNSVMSRKSELSPGVGSSSPIVISSSGSPCSASSFAICGSKAQKMSTLASSRDRVVRTNGRNSSLSSTNSFNFGDFDANSWKSVERKVERATNLLAEITSPVARGGGRGLHDKSRVGPNRSTNEVIVIEEETPVPVRKPSTGQSCWTSSTPSNQRKRIDRLEPIRIDDSGDDDPEEAASKQTIRSDSKKKESTSVENYVRPGLRSLKEFEVSLKACPFTKRDFLKNLLDKTEEQVRNLKLRETEAELTEMRKMREEREAICSEKISNLLRLTRRLPVPIEEEYIELKDEDDDDDDDDVLIEEDAAARDDFPELTDKQEEMVSRALKCGNPGQTLSEGFKLQITARDIGTLAGLNWLNDEVINFYLNLVVDRSANNKKLPAAYAFNTFFYPKVVMDGQKAVRRWTKNVDVFAHSFVLVPIHLGMHWCLAVIDFPKKEIRYYDSMGGCNDKCLDALQRYLVDEMKDKKQNSFDTTGWKKINVKGIPQQMNGSDCGMFACKFAEYITRNAKITFNQSHMPYFRRRMVYEILTKKLL